MILFLLTTLLFASAHGYLCCSDVWDDRSHRDCQRRNTPRNGNSRVTRTMAWRNMDNSINAWNKVTNFYNQPPRVKFPEGWDCCLDACCHKTSWGHGAGFYSVGTPHITITCPPVTGDGTPVPDVFVGRKHYDCDTGELQPFTRRRRAERVYDDGEITHVSYAPQWVELKVPELAAPKAEEPARRLAETEAAEVDLKVERAPFVNKVVKDINRRRMGMAETKQIGYLGCFTDNGHRDLDYYKGSGMDALKCSNACARYLYFGLQYYGQCFCGNAYATSSAYYRRPDAECGSDLKGRAWRNAIFMHNSFNVGLSVYDHRHFQSASMSSIYGSYSAHKCIDGNPNSFCHTGYENRAWMRFSLKSAVTVVKVHVANRKDCCQNRLGRFKVMLYTHNGWEECRRGVQTDTSKQIQEVWCWRPTRATQVQIQFEDDHSHSYFHIADVKISGMEPKAQYIGCFRDDGNRDLDRYVGTFSSIETCRDRCKKYYYFGVQYHGQCFCSGGYSNGPQYKKLPDSYCGSDLKGRAWTNAVFATHGGIPAHETSASKLGRRRWDYAVDNEDEDWWDLKDDVLDQVAPSESASWADISEFGRDLLDKVITYGTCLAHQVEEWMKAHPMAMRVVEALGVLVIIGLAIFALPEEIIGGAMAGTAWLVEEGIGAIEGALGLAPKAALIGSAGSVPSVLTAGNIGSLGSVAGIATTLGGVAMGGNPVNVITGGGGNNVVNNVINSIGGLFGRRRVEDLLAEPDLATALEDEVQKALRRLDEDGHDVLKDGLSRMLEQYTSKDDLLNAEYKTFDHIMSSVNIELDDEMMGKMTDYFEAFDDLLKADTEAATKCIEEGCTMEEMELLSSGQASEPIDESSEPSGEGNGEGSAQPRVGPLHAVDTEAAPPLEIDLGEETEADFPEIDDTEPEQLYDMAEDGSIVAKATQS